MGPRRSPGVPTQSQGFGLIPDTGVVPGAVPGFGLDPGSGWGHINIADLVAVVRLGAVLQVEQYFIAFLINISTQQFRH